MKQPLVLGIGNVLMGDEGVGVHAVRRLEEAGLPPHVAIADGGTGGFHLLEMIAAHDPILMIDATMDGQAPGTVSYIEPHYASDFPRSLTAHDIGLRDLIESATLLGQLPRMRLLTVSVAELQPMELTLSRDVEASIPHVIARVKELLSS